MAQKLLRFFNAATRCMPSRRRIAHTCQRSAGGDKQLNDPLEHATGIEKRELLAKSGGCADPYNVEMLKRGAGTKDCPTLIPSCFAGRLVGCLCHEDQHYVNWMWLEKGCPKRCECGHWFKLYTAKPL